MRKADDVTMRFSLRADGFFQCGESRVVPWGVTYLPAGCDNALHMWREWPEIEIRADLALVQQLGMTAIRVPGYDDDLRPADLEARRRKFAEWCEESGLGVVSATNVICATCTPRPDTHLLPFDGLTDPFFHTFLPFRVRLARAAGATVLVELGFENTHGARQHETMLRALLPAARAAGAAGFFWKSLRADGLLDDEGRVSRGAEFFREFCRTLATDPVDAAPDGSLALLVPRVSEGDLDAKRRNLVAQYFLQRAGTAPWQVLPVDQPMPGSVKRLFVAGVPVTSAEVAGLCAWVNAGGEIFWHGPDVLSWDATRAAFFGARPVDWRSARGISVNAFGERFTFAHFPGDIRAELELAGATMLAGDQHGFPVLVEHRLGRGRIRYALPLVEDAIMPVAGHPGARDRWLSWYRGLLAP